MSSEVEEWRASAQPPGYMVSSFGRVMRATWIGALPGGRGYRRYGGKPWAGCWDGSRMILQFRGRTYKVHRMVCEAFSGPPPFEGAVVMHIDENARNNRADNLKWGTQSENLNAPLYLTRRSERAARRILTPHLVAWIKQRRLAGEKCVSLARATGVSPSTISNIMAGRAWGHVLPPVERD